MNAQALTNSRTQRAESNGIDARKTRPNRATGDSTVDVKLAVDRRGLTRLLGNDPALPIVSALLKADQSAFGNRYVLRMASQSRGQLRERVQPPSTLRAKPIVGSVQRRGGEESSPARDPETWHAAVDIGVRATNVRSDMVKAHSSLANAINEVKVKLADIARHDENVKWLFLDFFLELVPEPIDKVAKISAKGVKVALALSDTFKDLESRLAERLEPSAYGKFLEKYLRDFYSGFYYQLEKVRSPEEIYSKILSGEMNPDSLRQELRLLRRKFEPDKTSQAVYRAKITFLIDKFEAQVKPIGVKKVPAYQGLFVSKAAVWVSMNKGTFLALVKFHKTNDDGHVIVLGKPKFMSWILTHVGEAALKKQADLSGGREVPTLGYGEIEGIGSDVWVHGRPLKSPVMSK